ncbi:MAG: DUF4304 domain-containing protein [Nocardioides sp.]|nr:DUF4304 domain-containing protein [Nocardioides sp.]
MEGVEAIESSLATVFKLRGFRKRARNWFRTTSDGQYQVVNLQQSSWGGSDCYVNLGWDPVVPDKGFRPAHECCLSVRAEQTDVIPSIPIRRPDGVTTTEVPGISLLNSEMHLGKVAGDLIDDVTAVIALPVADLMDRTTTMADLVPFLTSKPWFTTRMVREYLTPMGYELPTSW